MSESITIRSARSEDKDAILAFCKNTFSWGDYIPERWDDWLHGTRGQLLVAELGGQQVGLMHVQLLEDGAAWIEGVRVHPDFRRRGIATALNAAGRAYAISESCKALRLATGADNIASQNLFGSRGYSRISEHGEWLAKPTGKESASVQVATEQDLPHIVDLWSRVAHTRIVENAEWHWELVSDATLGKLTALGKIRVLPNGFAILRETDDSSLILQALIGDEDSMCTLALAARVESGYRGMERADAVIVDDAAVNRALVCAGFQREGGMFVYEQSLR